MEEEGYCEAERKKKGLRKERYEAIQVVFLARNYIAVVEGWDEGGEEIWADVMWMWKEMEQGLSTFNVGANSPNIMHSYISRMFRDALTHRSAKRSTLHVSDPMKCNSWFWLAVAGVCICYKVRFVKGGSVSSGEELEAPTGAHNSGVCQGVADHWLLFSLWCRCSSSNLGVPNNCFIHEEFCPGVWRSGKWSGLQWARGWQEDIWTGAEQVWHGQNDGHM